MNMKMVKNLSQTTEFFLMIDFLGTSEEVLEDNCVAPPKALEAFDAG